MAGSTPWCEQRAREIIASHAGVDGPLLPILHSLQEEFGHIPEESVTLVADTLNRSRAEIWGVVTFYHDFHREPHGRHVLKLCRAEACQSRGADGLHAKVHAKLGTGWGETTTDGRITVEPVFCLGLCAQAPSAMLDGEPTGNLDWDQMQTLIEEAK
jgi:formate dehydrogenase subunit gamma